MGYGGSPCDTSPTKLKINIILSHSDDRVTVGIHCVLTDAYNFNKRGVQKMSRILVVDDDARIRQIIRKYAEFEGFEVEEAVDGMQAIEICRKEDFDLIIMDVMMPELDGFSACREIRKFKKTPIIMLSARGEEYDKIHGFELGSDDYVVKPFSPKELMMRVNAVIKRSQGAQNEENVKKDVFTYEGLSVDFSARIVTIDGKRIEMTPKEYELFFYMVKNKGLALTREKLISEVWGYDFFGDERTLDTHIKLLRKSLGEYSRCIVTLRGVGYRFETI
jgi:two-component system response regulator ResD